MIATYFGMCYDFDTGGQILGPTKYPAGYSITIAGCDLKKEVIVFTRRALRCSSVETCCNASGLLPPGGEGHWR